MAALLLHLTSIERLTVDARRLPAEIRAALDEDLPYARLGSALPDLPRFAGIRGGLQTFGIRRKPGRFERLFHGQAPVAMGLKMAELVAIGALVGKGPGRAFVSGYFAHLCLDRVLHPLVETLAARQRGPKESNDNAVARIDWMHALFYLRDLHGRDMVGNHYLRPRFQVTKRAVSPTRGIGRGIYELIRLSAQEALKEAPTKSEVDSWVRGLFLYGAGLSSRLGRMRGLPSEADGAYRTLFHGPDVDVPAALARAQSMTQDVLELLSSLMTRTHFTARVRARFLDAFPEGSSAVCST